MHANFVKVEDRIEQAHVPVRGAARANVAQNFGVSACQVFGAQRGDGASAHIGDVGGVHDGHWRAGFGVKQVENGQLGGQANFVVLVVIAHHFDPRQSQRANVAAQHIEVTGKIFLGHQVHAWFYGDLLVALRLQRLLHRPNDLGIGQGQGLHIRMVQVG